MRYAIVIDGVVVNIIWLEDRNAHEFPNAIKLSDRPVAIGDSYIDGRFYREGKEVMTELEEATAIAYNLAERVVDLELAMLEV